MRSEATDRGLDLTALPDNQITSIETIDLRGAGFNTRTLDASEVLAITLSSRFRGGRTL